MTSSVGRCWAVVGVWQTILRMVACSWLRRRAGQFPSRLAALRATAGEVISQCYRRYQSVERNQVLGIIDKRVPANLEIHLILDNYATQRTAIIQEWLLGRPRLHLHFAPTDAFWFSQVKRWLSEITGR